MKSDDLKTWCHEGLSTRGAALLAAREAWRKGQDGSLESIHRIVGSILKLCAVCGACEITEAADRVAQSKGPVLGEALDHLMGLIHTMDGIPEARQKLILAVDTDAERRGLLHDRLTSSGRRLLEADSVARAGEILAGSSVQLILLGLSLPDGDARDLLMRLKDEPATASIPVIILGDEPERRTRLECLALGAEDFLPRPLDLDHLATVVSARLQRAEEISRDSLHDPLTRLPNRGAFVEAFLRAQSHAARTREAVSVALLDLDHLQMINDSYGRSVGNGVLRRFSAVVSQAMRKSDLLARWGPEGFAVLFPDTGCKGATRALEKALATLRGGSFRAKDGGRFKATFSAGVARVGPRDDLENVIQQALKLMNSAKASGRNRVLSSEDNAAGQETRVLLAEDDPIITSVLKHRLAREGFEVSAFSDGSAALESCKSGGPDLIIMDVQIHGLDGLELLRRFRSISYLRKVPIVLLAGLGSDQTVTKALEMGANDAITKPFSPVELVARIRRQLTRS